MIVRLILNAFFPVIVRDTSEFVCCPGSPVLIHREARFNGQSTVLVEVGRSDLREMMSAQVPFCDINYMLHRLSLGDHSVLSRVQPMYGDFTSIPTAPHDILNIARAAESRFVHLSDEEKAACNNDYRVWLVRCMRGGSGSSQISSAPVSAGDNSSSEVKT